MLIIFGGLPGVGKTAIAAELARLIGAVHLRIDSIEQAIRASGVVSQTLNDAGYRVAYAVAEDNLRIGRTVIADSVNPLHLTRDAWVGVANRVQVKAIEIEVKCSDANEHRRRVETPKPQVSRTSRRGAYPVCDLSFPNSHTHHTAFSGSKKMIPHQEEENAGG